MNTQKYEVRNREAEDGERKAETRIKLWPFVVLILALLIIPSVGGCSVLGTDTSAPNVVEQKLLTTVTNFVEVPVTKTITNYVSKDVVVYTTNTVGQIVTVTNTVTQPIYSTVTVTNVIPQYQNTVSDNTKATVTAGGSILNTFFPGIGSMVSSGVLALLALWAHLRSGKRQQTAAALTQQMETVLEFIQTLPNGAAYKTAITNFLQAHQMESGVAEQVLDLLANQVSNPDAKAAVEEIKNAIAASVGAATATK